MTTKNANGATKPISIALSTDLHRRVRVYCASQGLTLSRLVRDLLDAAVADLDSELVGIGGGVHVTVESHEAAA